MCTFRPVSEPVEDCHSIKTKVFDRDELLHCYVNRVKDYIITNSVWDRIYKSELIRKIRFMPDKLNEDILYTMEVFLKADTVVYISEKFYQYRDIREGNISEKKVSLRSINDKNYLTKIAAEKLRENGYIKLADIYETMNFLEVSELVAFNNEKFDNSILEYRKYMAKVIKRVVVNSNLRVKTKIRIGMAYTFPRLEKYASRFYGKILKRK